MDLFLDRERLQRFDLSKGPSTLSRMVVRGPFNVTDRGNTASRAKSLHLPSDELRQRRSPVRVGF